MILADSIAPADVERILALYDEICEGDLTSAVKPEEVCKLFRAGDEGRMDLRQGYRIGSRWDIHSKLRFEVGEQGQVVATMYENFDPKDRRDDNPDYVAAKKAAQKFTEAVAKL